MPTSQAVLDVGGMHCHSCSELIDEVLVDLPGVLGATTDRVANTSTVQFDPDAVSVGELVAAIEELGYTATPQ